MKTAEYYTGREQTYIKHFFLERYLERVAYIIGYSMERFVYVDGFSGPWKSEDEEFQDTSFVIAINKLREVVEGLSKVGKHPDIRCLFVEKNPEAYEALRSAVAERKRVSYDEACDAVLELPLVWESDVKDLADALQQASEIDIEGMGPRERRVKSGHYLVLKT